MNALPLHLFVPAIRHILCAEEDAAILPGVSNLTGTVVASASDLYRVGDRVLIGATSQKLWEGDVGGTMSFVVADHDVLARIG